jgi:hypothetical protein
MDCDTIIISNWSKDKDVSYYNDKRPSGDFTISAIRHFVNTSKYCSDDGIILDGFDIILYHWNIIVKFICHGDIVTRILIDQNNSSTCEIMYQNDIGKYSIHLKHSVLMDNHSISTNKDSVEPFTIEHSQLQNRYTFEQISKLPIDCESIASVNELLGYGRVQKHYRIVMEKIQKGEPTNNDASEDFSDMESE